MTDILQSLERFGFEKTVLFNAHGDGLQKSALKQVIIECNAKLKMKTFWPIYEDDIEYEGFTGKEDYLALIPPFAFERAFKIEQFPKDEFDIHAGAFETAMMQEIMPELVRNEKLEGLEPTLLEGDQRRLWNEGEPQNKYLIPKGYVGDPAGSKYVKSDMATVYKEYADGLAQFFGF